MLRFTTGSRNNKAGKLWTLDNAGAPVLIADLYAYEKAANPDRKTRYGFSTLSKSCLAQLPKSFPASYKGVKESHPYATATANGITYVADAGATRSSRSRPPGRSRRSRPCHRPRSWSPSPAPRPTVPPGCTVGNKFALEAVPTDVEVGPDGNLYITSLPGGPEDGSLGVNGRVLRVAPGGGKVETLLRKLVSPTGIAVATNGDMYVAHLFMGAISKIKAGKSKVKPYVQLPLPAAVEVTPTGLLATIKTLPAKKPKGQVVTITP